MKRNNVFDKLLHKIMTKPLYRLAEIQGLVREISNARLRGDEQDALMAQLQANVRRVLDVVREVQE